MQNKTQRGVSLVELMVVVAIVSLLNGLALQASLQCIERAKGVMAVMTEQANRLYSAAATVDGCANASPSADERPCE
ncbi:MAG: prepilin-type N-terminal cleavage/methylation domain-containing protein [Leptothrix sp. (in: b-proteobacteria)]